MARLWFCPKCSNRIVVTVLMEDFPFRCSHCYEIWGRDDMEHFAMGLSTFDVADVHDWLEQRKKLAEESVIIITVREQVLIATLELLLDDARSKGNVRYIGIIEKCIKKFAEACYNNKIDWCETQYQQERRNDVRKKG